MYNFEDIPLRGDLIKLDRAINQKGGCWFYCGLLLGSTYLILKEKVED